MKMCVCQWWNTLWRAVQRSRTGPEEMVRAVRAVAAVPAGRAFWFGAYGKRAQVRTRKVSPPCTSPPCTSPPCTHIATHTASRSLWPGAGPYGWRAST